MMGTVLLFGVSYVFPLLYFVAIIFFLAIVFFALVEIFVLYRNSKGIQAARNTPKKLSNGDDNDITLTIKNHYGMSTNLKVIDEIPFQFQRRDIQWSKVLTPKEELTFKYQLRPVKRGEYCFGAVNILASIGLNLVERRFAFDQGAIVPVYPSYLQMAKFELAAFSQNLTELGLKKIRRRGQSQEFDSIKDYVIGDDPRTINWKASAKTRTLKVNEYVDERSQQIYCLIDKGRLMKMPFENLTLLDYAINATLVLSNIAIKKQDRAGLLTFSNKLSSVLMADKRPAQMYKIQEMLYAQKTRYAESNFELVSTYVSRKLTHRSLLFLYTNFESYHSFERQFEYFKVLARKHLLVVVFFQNVELKELIENEPQSIKDIYTQIVAEKSENEKMLITKKLRQYGIYSVLSTPKELNINTINKYLEIKARNLM